ncbi:DUF6497 family protein [Profundibacter sp.]|uniref:DUF6497 family protein n=1 Tax=Profundibacter sp. TaxID=3101071 RepID=UPI003D0A460D
MRARRPFLVAIVMAAAGPLLAGAIDVPSGQPITFQDVIWEAEGGENTFRFRYITPEISRDGGSVEFDQAEGDMRYLCEHSALPALIEQERDVDHIVISLSDRPVEFGKADPAATQFFDSYSPQGNNCIWEGF